MTNPSYPVLWIRIKRMPIMDGNMFIILSLKKKPFSCENGSVLFKQIIPFS
jgi:hypothetical protein